MDSNGLLRLCEFVRTLSPDLTVGQLQTLIEVMRGDEIPTMTEIATRTGQPLVTISRHCAQFGPVRKNLPAALELLRLEEDDDDRRRSVVVLTTKGKNVANQIRKMLKD